MVPRSTWTLAIEAVSNVTLRIYTRFLFTGQPPRRSITWMHR